MKTKSVTVNQKDLKQMTDTQLDSIIINLKHMIYYAELEKNVRNY